MSDIQESVFMDVRVCAVRCGWFEKPFSYPPRGICPDCGANLVVVRGRYRYRKLFSPPRYEYLEFIPLQPAVDSAQPAIGPTYYVQHPDGTYSIADPQPCFVPTREVWRHEKTSGLYGIVGSGRLEREGEKGRKWILYRSFQDGLGWLRPAKEFFDGRFTLVEDNRFGEESLRGRFESWIASSPYERSVLRWPNSPEKHAWPGQYQDHGVQLAWEAWVEAMWREATDMYHRHG